MYAPESTTIASAISLGIGACSYHISSGRERSQATGLQEINSRPMNDNVSNQGLWFVAEARHAVKTPTKARSRSNGNAGSTYDTSEVDLQRYPMLMTRKPRFGSIL